MPTIQLVLDPTTYAELAYLAGVMQRRKADVALDLLKEAVSQKHNEYLNKPANTKVMLSTPVQHPTIRRGRSGQAVLYKGSDPRLQNGKTYKNYAEVLRIVQPDLARLHPDGLLYNRETRHGDKAENILKHNEPSVYKNLVRQQRLP